MNNKVINIVSSSAVYIEESCLVSLNKLLKKFNMEKSLQGNIWSIPTGTIGHINIEGLTININPNIEYLRNFDYLRLLQQNNVDNTQNGYLDLVSSNNNFEEFIITLFIEYLEVLIKNGIPQRYQLINNRGRFLKGIVNLPSTYKNYLLGNNDYVESRIEVLSLNYTEAITIKAAYEKVCGIHMKYRKPSLTTALKSIPNDRNIFKSKKKYICSKKAFNKNLIQAYELADIILRNLNSLHLEGVNSTSLLLNANKIFEDYISTLLIKEFPREDFKLQVNVLAAYFKDKKINSKPDILYLGPEKVVIDVKNKNFNRAITSDNYHQMISYMNTFKVKTAILIYPDDRDNDEILFKVTSDDTLKIYAVSFNLRQQNPKPLVEKLSSILQFG